MIKFELIYKLSDENEELRTLTGEQGIFIRHMMDKYNGLSYRNILHIVGCIDLILYIEYGHHYYKNKLFFEQKSDKSISLLCNIFDKLKALESIDYTYDSETFSGLHNNHEELLFLLGHPQFIDNEKFLKHIKDFPEDYKADQHIKIRELTKDILDRMAEGSIRRHQLAYIQDLTQEEQIMVGIWDLSPEEKKKFYFLPKDYDGFHGGDVEIARLAVEAFNIARCNEYNNITANSEITGKKRAHFEEEIVDQEFSFKRNG